MEFRFANPRCISVCKTISYLVGAAGPGAVAAARECGIGLVAFRFAERCGSGQRVGTFASRAGMAMPVCIGTTEFPDGAAPWKPDTTYLLNFISRPGKF